LAQLHYAQSREQLRKRLAPEVAQVSLTKAELDNLTPESVHYGCFAYQTLNSWSQARRVVCKLTWGASGVRHHFVVTSISAQAVPCERLHRDYYCPRGEMENRLKEQQLDLFSGRTSNHYFDDNQLRLWLSSFAYVLLNACAKKIAKLNKLLDKVTSTVKLLEKISGGKKLLKELRRHIDDLQTYLSIDKLNLTKAGGVLNNIVGTLREAQVANKLQSKGVKVEHLAKEIKKINPTDGLVDGQNSGSKTVRSNSEFTF
jgi:Transposase DDE domain group 1